MPTYSGVGKLGKEILYVSKGFWPRKMLLELMNKDNILSYLNFHSVCLCSFYNLGSI